MAEGYTIGDIVERTGGQDRTLRFWADRGALRADNATDQAGRGIHRRFDWREVEVAAALVAITPFGLSIGQMIEFARIVRMITMMDGTLPPPGSAVAFADDAAGAKLSTAIQAGRSGRASFELILLPHTPDAPRGVTPCYPDGSGPFDYFMRWPGLDPSEAAAIGTRKAALTIDLGECWKGLRR